MHCIKVHKGIALMISFFYLIGFWHRGEKPSARELRLKVFHSFWQILYFLSLLFGAFTNEKMDKSIFLTDAAVGVGVYAIKLWILIWKQNEILDLLHRICEYSIHNDIDYALCQDKLRRFVKFSIVFVMAFLIGGVSAVLLLPFIGSEKTLFFEIWFPLDWRNSEVAFWLATFFVLIGATLTVIAASSSIFIWYFLLNCSLRYEELGSGLNNLGRVTENGNLKISEIQMHRNYFENLKEIIDAHLHLKELTEELNSFYSNLFLVQFGISAMCICLSIYCLAFDLGNSLLERVFYFLVMFYFISELFMITYFGNEIMLSSDRLSYSLFESDWYNQPHSTKNCVIIFGEYLKQPQVLVIGKLYPLTLETFTRIINSAYSMFNILKSFKE